MKKQISKVIEKLKRTKRARGNRGRRLQVESLEGRRLMASDLHNALIAEDVNRDFKVSPIDALLVVNAINKARRTGAGEGEGTTAFVDVNGDSRLTPMDALLVVNRLRAEGEDQIKLVSYTASITDTSGNPFPNNQIVVGSTFRVRVVAQDLRTTSELGFGLFNAAVDLDFNTFELNGSTAKPVASVVTLPTAVNSTTLTVGPNFESIFGAIGAVGSDQELDEVEAFTTDLGGALETPDPELFYFVDFVALSTGVISVTPNATEDADTLLKGSDLEVVPGAQTFGGANLRIVADPNTPTANNATANGVEDIVLALPSIGSTIASPLSATSPAGRTLTLQSINIISGTTSGTLTLNGSAYTYAPAPNSFGNDLLTYTVRDTAGLTSTATLTIAVAPVNDPPTAVADNFPLVGDTPIKGDSTDNVLEVLANDSRGPANESTQPLTITAVSSSQGANKGDQGGSITIFNGTLLYTPLPGFDGTETFTYTISDSAATSTATVTVFVEPGVRPFARRDTESVLEGSTAGVVINVLANDAVNEGVGVLPRLITFTQPANGTVTRIPGASPNDTDDQLLYVPNDNFNGTDVFTYELRDTSGQGDPSIGRVTITVTDVNDPPQLANDTLPPGTEDRAVTVAISTLLGNDSPGIGEIPNPPVTPGQTLTIVSVASANGTAAIVGSNIVFTPAADRNGNLSFTYTARDSGSPAIEATATVFVNFVAENDAPVVANDLKTTAEDVQLVFAATDLLVNDRVGPATALDETEGFGGVTPQTLTVQSVGTASSGSVALVNGQVTYTPASNFNGQATFNYVARDSAGAETTGVVTVTITPVNDNPIATPDSAIAYRGIPLTIPVSTLLGNDSAGPSNANESNQTISIASVGNAVNGSVTLNAVTGIVTFVPNDGYTGPASFEYTLQDNGTSNGLADPKQATGLVSVDVLEFIPSTISGYVYIDDKGDGVKQASERALGGVTVTLTGTALGQPVSLSYITLADGSYHFDGLAPGNFTVRFGNPSTWGNGLDTAGNVGDADGIANNDAFGINIVSPGGVNGTNYNFAVTGLQNGYGSILDRLASRYYLTSGTSSTAGLYAVVNPNGSMQSFAALDGYSGIKFAETVINSNGTEVLLTIVTNALEVKTAKLGKGQFYVTHDAAGTAIIRVVGGMNDLNFETISSGPANYLAAVDRIFAQEGW